MVEYHSKYMHVMMYQKCHVLFKTVFTYNITRLFDIKEDPKKAIICCDWWHSNTENHIMLLSTGVLKKKDIDITRENTSKWKWILISQCCSNFRCLLSTLMLFYSSAGAKKKATISYTQCKESVEVPFHWFANKEKPFWK